FGGTLSSCSATWASFSTFLDSPIGPGCIWDIWLDPTAISGSLPGGGCKAGLISFTPAAGSPPFADLVVPLTVCITDSPALTVNIPATFPDPLFGVRSQNNLYTLFPLPSNLPSGFPQSLVEVPLPANGVTLLNEIPATSQVCQVVDIHTNG